MGRTGLISAGFQSMLRFVNVFRQKGSYVGAHMKQYLTEAKKLKDLATRHRNRDLS